MSNATGKKRKVIQSEGRAIIASVYHFLQEEYKFMKATNHDYCDLSPLANIRKRTANATGVSERTVTTILKEEKELPSPFAEFPSPMKKRRKRKSKFDLDINVIRQIIKIYHTEHTKVPSLVKLRLLLNEKIGFDGCLNTLRSLLLKMGYKLKKNCRNRSVLQLKTRTGGVDTESARKIKKGKENVCTEIARNVKEKEEVYTEEKEIEISMEPVENMKEEK